MALQFWQQYSKLTAWYPTNLPGCILWLDGDHVTKDGSNYVSLFSDQSGQLNNATQPTGINQPLWVDNQLNGKPIVRFAGGNDFMEFASGFLYNLTDISLFIVIKPVIGGVTGIFGPSVIEKGMEMFTLAGYELRVNNVPKSGTVLYTNNIFTINDFVYNAVSTNGYKDGAALTPSTGGGALNYNGVYSLGRLGGAYYSVFDVAEIVIYNNSLSDSNRILVEEYLSVKYFSFINIIPKMTSNTTPSGVASASIAVGGNAFYAFDKTINTEWSARTYGYQLPQWIAYEFPTPRTIKKYAITGTTTAVDGYNPKSWQFQGYDGANWIDLDVVINEAQFGNYERREYVVDTPTSYISYRLYVTAAQLSIFVQITEIEMSEI
jgi:hypothetical protein